MKYKISFFYWNLLQILLSINDFKKIIFFFSKKLHRFGYFPHPNKIPNTHFTLSCTLFSSSLDLLFSSSPKLNRSSLFAKNCRYHVYPTPTDWIYNFPPHFVMPSLMCFLFIYSKQQIQRGRKFLVGWSYIANQFAGIEDLCMWYSSFFFYYFQLWLWNLFEISGFFDNFLYLFFQL